MMQQCDIERFLVAGFSARERTPAARLQLVLFTIITIIIIIIAKN
jgi:hypothetical protein